MWLRSNVAVTLCCKQYIKYSINTPLRLLLPAGAARLAELAEQHSSSVQSCQPLVCHSLLIASRPFACQLLRVAEPLQSVVQIFAMHCVTVRGGVIIRIIQMFEYRIMGALIRIIFE